MNKKTELSPPNFVTQNDAPNSFGMSDPNNPLTPADFNAMRAFIRAAPNKGIVAEDGVYYRTFREFRVAQASARDSKNKAATGDAMLKRDVLPS